MTGRSQRLLARDKAMADLAAAGKTVAEIADVLDVNPQLVRIWAKLAGVKLVRQTKKSDERADRMALMYRQGVTLAKIGNQYGLTRERVRQIIGKTGITAAEGGASKSAEYRREAAAAKREAVWLAKYGLPYAVVRQLQADRVTHAFHKHKRNSDSRGIDFRLTFIAWLSIWQASGKLDQRGRGKGKYVMSRINDAGAYELGNVHIQLATENSREAVKKWAGKTKENRGVYLLTPGSAHPWMAKVARVSLGRFATEQEAVAARAAYLDAHPEATKPSRGYAHIKATHRSPARFQVVVNKRYVGIYRSPEEALAARAAYLAAPQETSGEVA